jgi:hypothetical protein
MCEARTAQRTQKVFYVKVKEPDATERLSGRAAGEGGQIIAYDYKQ